MKRKRTIISSNSFVRRRQFRTRTHNKRLKKKTKRYWDIARKYAFKIVKEKKKVNNLLGLITNITTNLLPVIF